MTGDELFGELPPQVWPQAAEGGRAAPRLREPERDQIELRAVDIDSLIGEDHLVRVIWAYVAGLDLSELEDRVKARDNRPGHPATSPRLLLALWLYATSEGVGSARALERLCDNHDVYRWLCGGVSVNYHTLADFRLGCADLLDRLLVEHVAALAKAGLVNLDTLAQDGVRLRASAGAASFRREATLDRHLATAQALGEIKKQRQEREDKRGNGKPPKEPRASTTDAEARVMKMADGGFRPAYNVQVASAAGEQIVVAVEVTNTGSDRGLLRPMLQQLRVRTGHFPGRHLADGGFGSAQDIEWAHGEGIAVYCPPTQSKHGTDPYLPRRGDREGVLAWRERMASEAGKALYKRRSICECIHARWRNWDLRQLTVRSIAKVRAVVLYYALANNILQGHRLATA